MISDPAYQLRNSLLRTRTIQTPRSYMTAYRYKRRRDFYRFLGWNKDAKLNSISTRILPNSIDERSKRKDIFSYVLNFWEETTLYVPYGRSLGKGLNLAKNPFLVPSAGEKQFFGEQYRWDTRFQNLGLIVVGGIRLAIGQLENLEYVYKKYGKIPNALSTDFLTHAQPMMESTAVFDLLENGVKPGKWSDDMMDVVTMELFTEWIDLWEKKVRYRITPEMYERYGLLSRHVNTHFSAFLVGTEDGKDHNWISAKYGEHYLPVQLNSIIYKVITDIITYYTTYSPSPEKVTRFKKLQDEFYNNFQKTFWTEKPGWVGFFNYAINPDKTNGHYEGPIFFDELAEDIFPLWAKIATKEQAETLVRNIKSKYETPNGLLTATNINREGSTFKKGTLEGWQFQWDYPNIWPPLMQIAVEGLMNYGYDELAIDYMRRWVKYVEHEFFKRGAFFEKYTFDDAVPINEGYYGLEIGFGWTIGTYIWMLHYLDKVGEVPFAVGI